MELDLLDDDSQALLSKLVPDNKRIIAAQQKSIAKAVLDIEEERAPLNTVSLSKKLPYAVTQGTPVTKLALVDFAGLLRHQYMDVVSLVFSCSLQAFVFQQDHGHKVVSLRNASCRRRSLAEQLMCQRQCAQIPKTTHGLTSLAVTTRTAPSFQRYTGS